MDNLVKVSTSGTTGKSLSIYVDMFDIIMGLFGYLRTIKEYGLNWRKSNISIIGDFAPHTAETGYVKKGLFPNSDKSKTWHRWADCLSWLEIQSSCE